MRSCYIILLLSIFSFYGQSQSRVYFNAGTNYITNYFREGFYRLGVGNRVFVTSSDYRTKKLGRYWNAEINVETRMNRILYVVTGISFAQSGYRSSSTAANTDEVLFFSDLDITHLGIPFMIRVNFVNAVMIDAGYVARFPISAILDETGNKGNQFEVNARENIASSLNRFDLAPIAQLTVLINRLTLTYYVTVGGHEIDSEFINEWPLRENRQSLFLRDVFPKFNYAWMGFKMGFRII